MVVSMLDEVVFDYADASEYIYRHMLSMINDITREQIRAYQSGNVKASVILEEALTYYMDRMEEVKEKGQVQADFDTWRSCRLAIREFRAGAITRSQFAKRWAQLFNNLSNQEA